MTGVKVDRRAFSPQNTARTIIASGMRFGLWTTLRGGRRSIDKILCRCQCGVERMVVASSLTLGHSTYCGRYRNHPERKTNATKHGENARGRKKKEYSTWLGIKKRCFNPKEPGYKDYGGRGIRMCPQWVASFEGFLADVGRAPSQDHTIERVDTNGHYEPGNVVWATAVEQARNKRVTVRLTFNGETRLLVEWARIVGLSPNALRGRLYKGWSVETALTRPKGRHV